MNACYLNVNFKKPVRKKQAFELGVYVGETSKIIIDFKQVSWSLQEERKRTKEIDVTQSRLIVNVGTIFFSTTASR